MVGILSIYINMKHSSSSAYTSDNDGRRWSSVADLEGGVWGVRPPKIRKAYVIQR
jgi:hypothetical protein